jgi:UDP-N-acetyl-D-mannosaminuronic acid dehydrogenase
MSADFQSVSIIGLGYIGLPTAAMLASRKINVIGVDVDHRAVEIINQGRIHIVEPELDMIVSAAVSRGYLRATTKPEPADAFLIAVPTPFKEDHQPDTRFVEAAAKSIASVLKKGDLVILESTSPVGTTEQMSVWLAEARPDLSFPQQRGEYADVSVAYCPERVLPGKVVRELVNNDRVIGGMTKRCSQRAMALYESFVQGKCIETSARTAEMCKLTENSFRDVNIAFANELSVICDKLGVDVWELIALANRHPRVNILQPGPGVGGHCIAVDPWFIVSAAPDDARLIRSAREVNDAKPKWVIDKVTAAVSAYAAAHPGRDASTVNVACLGLAFKADIDDLRESPAAHIALTLAAQHTGTVFAVEPNISALPAKWDTRLVLTGLDDAFSRADVVVLLVDHKTFKEIPTAVFAGKAVVDCRGIIGHAVP